MERNNEHIFSDDYNEKKESLLRSLNKNVRKEGRTISAKPVKVLLAVALMSVILTTSLLATGVIPMPKYIFRADYLPDGVEKIVSPDERMTIEGFPTLEYYIQYLDGKTFTSITEEENVPDTVDYEVFEVNGHYAQILCFNHWIPEEDFDEYTNKQLIVYFEEEDLIVQVWATNIVTVEELKKVAEGLHLEATEDGSLAAKLYPVTE